MADKRGRAAIVLLGVFTAGLLLRILSGDALLSTALTYAAAPKPEAIPGPRSPEDTARSFYMLLDRGHYDKAWEMSVEPDWSGKPIGYKQNVAAAAHPAGWTQREAFEKRMTGELGRDGIWLKLHSVRADRIAVIEPIPAFLDELPAEEIFPIEVTGTFLGACTLFSWSKHLFVVRVNDNYKVLLEGTKPANSFFYQSWFANIEKIGSLRPDGS